MFLAFFIGVERMAFGKCFERKASCFNLLDIFARYSRSILFNPFICNLCKISEGK